MISMLVLQSIWDCKCRQIPLAITVAGGVIGLCVSIMTERSYTDMIMGFFPGAICLVIGWITREAIGYGDGFLLCAMGMYLSAENIVAIVTIASFFAGIVGLILMVFGKKKGNDQLPFVPFLLMASVIYLVLEKGYA